MIPVSLEAFWYFNDHAILTGGLCRRFACLNCMGFTDSTAAPPWGGNPIWTDALRAPVASAIVEIVADLPKGEKWLHLGTVQRAPAQVELDLFDAVLRRISYSGVAIDGFYLDHEEGDARERQRVYRLYQRILAGAPAGVAAGAKIAMWEMARVAHGWAGAPIASPKFDVSASHFAYTTGQPGELERIDHDLAATSDHARLVHISTACPAEYNRQALAKLNRLLTPGRDIVVLFPDGQDWSIPADAPGNAPDLQRARAVQRLTDLMPVLSAVHA